MRGRKSENITKSIGVNYNLEMDRLPHIAVYIHCGNPHCTTSERAIFIFEKGSGC